MRLVGVLGRGLRRRAGVGRAVGVLVLPGLDLQRHDHRLPRADAVGIGLDLRQARRRQHGVEPAGIAGHGPVEGAAVGDLVVDDRAGPEVGVVGVDQLHELRLQPVAAQVFQAARLEALHEDRRVLGVEAVLLDDGDERVFQRAAARRAAAVGDGLRVVPGRVLGLGIDGDRAAERLALGLREIDDLLEAQDRNLPLNSAGRSLAAS